MVCPVSDTSVPHSQPQTTSNCNIKDPALTINALVDVAKHHLERQDYITAYHVFDILQGISPPPGTCYNNNNNNSHRFPPPIKYHLEQAKALYQLKEYHSALQLLRPILEFALWSQHSHVEHSHMYPSHGTAKGQCKYQYCDDGYSPVVEKHTGISGSNLSYNASRHNCYANNMSVSEESALLEALGGGNPSSSDFVALKELKVATKPTTQLILYDELGGPKRDALDLVMPAMGGMGSDTHISQSPGPNYNSRQTNRQRRDQPSPLKQESAESYYLRKYSCEALRVGMNCSFQLGEPRQTMMYAEALLVILSKQLEDKRRELEVLTGSQPRTRGETTEKGNKSDRHNCSGGLVVLGRCSSPNNRHEKQQRSMKEKLINIHQAHIRRINQQLVEPLILKAKAAEFVADTADALQCYREALKIDPYCISAMDSIQRRHLLTPQEQLDLIDELVFAPDLEVIRTVYRLKAYTQMMGSTANMTKCQNRGDDKDETNDSTTDCEYFVNGTSSVLRARQQGKGTCFYYYVDDACVGDRSHVAAPSTTSQSASPIYPEAEGIDINNNDDDNSIHEDIVGHTDNINVEEGDDVSNHHDISITQPQHSISQGGHVGVKERVTSASSGLPSVSTIRPSHSCAPHHQSLQRVIQHNTTDNEQHILGQTEMRPIKRKHRSPVETSGEYIADDDDDDDDEPLVDLNGQVLSISNQREQIMSQHDPKPRGTRTTLEELVDVTNTQPPQDGWNSTSTAQAKADCEGTATTAASQTHKPTSATVRRLYVKVPPCTLVGAYGCPLDGVPLIALLNHKARVELAQNNLTAMITTTEQATKLYPHDREAMCLHLLALVDSCSTARLFELGHELQRTRPYSEIAMYAIGCYYYSLGEHEKAGKYFGKATDLDASFAEAWVAYGHCYAKLEEGERALLTYRRATALFPGLVEVRALEGLQLTRVHNDGAASLALSYARDKSPGDPIILNESGVLAMREGALDKARELLEIAAHHILTLHCNEKTALREYNQKLVSEGVGPLFVSGAKNVGGNERKGVIRAMAYWVLKAPAVVLSEYYDIILFNLAILYRRLALFNDALGLLHLYLKGRAHAAHAQTAIGLTYHLKGDLNAAIICYHESLAHRNDPQCRMLLEKAMSEEFSLLDRGSNAGCGTEVKIESLMARRRGIVTASTVSCFMEHGVGSYGAGERDNPEQTDTTSGDDDRQHFKDPMVSNEGPIQSSHSQAYRGYQPQFSSAFHRRPPQTPSVNRSEVGDEVPERPHRGFWRRGGGSYLSTMGSRGTPNNDGPGTTGSYTIRQPCFSSASLTRSSVEFRGAGFGSGVGIPLEHREPSVTSTASSIPTFTTRLGSSNRGDDSGAVVSAEEEEQEEEYEDYHSNTYNKDYHNRNSTTIMYVPSDSNESSIGRHTTTDDIDIHLPTSIDYSSQVTSKGISLVTQSEEVREGRYSDIFVSNAGVSRPSLVSAREGGSSLSMLSSLRPPPPLPPGSPIASFRPPPPFNTETTVLPTTAAGGDRPSGVATASLDLVRPTIPNPNTVPCDWEEGTPSTTVPRVSTGGRASGR